jgi:hypothetical protein
VLVACSTGAFLEQLVRFYEASTAS